jgi:N-hydroxyarylamine O-acetyltransferase
MSFDLDAYFRRIGYSGPGAPTLDTLRALHTLHPQAIAFENLDPLLGRPVRLDLASLQAKLVRAGRGGYCFEQNALFGHVLRALGFDFIGLGARVLWMLPEHGPVPPRSHMLLKLHIEGESYLADVGFGGITLTAPLRLEPNVEQCTPHESFRLLEAGGHFILQVKLRDGWTSLYRFDLSQQFPADYEITNWYHSTSPSSQFTKDLVVARPATDRRYALRNMDFSVHHLDGTSEHRVLRGYVELRDILSGPFGLSLPDGADAILQHLTADAA